jgi:hypothetical protein
VRPSASRDARAKLVAEASVLREVKRWRDAFEVLAAPRSAFPTTATCSTSRP